MRQRTGKWVVAGVAAGLVGLCGSLCWRAAAQEALAATTSQAEVRAAAGRPGISLTDTLIFQFEDVTVDRVLAEMSARFGFVITKTVTIPQRVTIKVPRPLHADEALRLLNDVLVPLGYATLETHTGEGAEGKTSLRVAGLAEVKKAYIPVHVSGEPDDIALNNNIITQIIPLKNVDAVRLRNDLLPLMSADADTTANTEANAILITDTSAKIHRLVEMTAALDKLAGERPRRESASVGSSLPPGMTVVTGSAVMSGPLLKGQSPPRIASEAEVMVPRVGIVVPVDGILAKVLVNEGAEVKAGEVIAEMDGRAEEAELKATLARVELAKAEAARSEQAGKALDAAVSRAEMAAEEAEAARHRAAMAGLAIQAPLDGVLTRVNFRAGQFVRAGTALTEVVGRGEMRLAFRPSMTAGPDAFKVGTKIRLHVTGALQDYECEVTYVPPEGVNWDGLDMRARFTGSTERLKPGMRGTISVVEP
jgi:biotin carboxyl carrier protein